MLARLRRFIGKQRVIPWIGEFKETLAQAAFWVTPINFMMLAATFYFTTLRHIAPWFTLPMFVVTAVVIGVSILIAEYKYMTPSIWAFRGRQMGLRNNPNEVEDTPVIRRVYVKEHYGCSTGIRRRRSNRQGYRRY